MGRSLAGASGWCDDLPRRIKNVGAPTTEGTAIRQPLQTDEHADHEDAGHRQDEPRRGGEAADDGGVDEPADRDRSGVLVAVCLTDRTSDGLSAVYSFFEASSTRDGLGNYVVLWLIEQCRRIGLPYVYLGYWIRDSAKMAYKSRFPALECLTEHGWAPFAPSSPDK